MGHYDNCRPGYCGKCGAAPGNLRADGSCPFCSPDVPMTKTNFVRSEQPDLLTAWADAYRAFVGAFDTPVARRKDKSEYSIDARRRLCVFDEQFRAFLKENGDGKRDG